MIFGGLSEQEVEKIEELLKGSNIPYKIGMDQQMLEKNQENLNSVARAHMRTGDSISNHIIAIEIEEKDFKSMSESLKEKLLEFGITGEVPDEADFHSPEDHYPKDPFKEKPTKPNALIGILLILGFSIFLYNLLAK